MPWWGWIAIGAALLAAEIAIQTEFWLAVLGGAAIVVGLAATLGFEGPIWAQGALFAVLAVSLNVWLRRRLHEQFVGSAPGLAPELVGELGIALEVIERDALGQVELRGSNWRARNVGSEAIASGGRVQVEAKDGIQLDVRGA